MPLLFGATYEDSGIDLSGTLSLCLTVISLCNYVARAKSADPDQTDKDT